MYALLLVLIVVLLCLVQGREHFALIVGGRDWFSFDGRTEDGIEVVNTSPNTCPTDKPELDAGLCYTPCRTGFHGVGPVCWADSVNVGVGVPVGLEPCPDGWNNDGLICRQPITNDCSWRGAFKECWGKLQGGRLKGRLDGGGVCSGPGAVKPDHPDRISGLCYKKCPSHLPVHVPGMPYLCNKGEGLSYGRGAGAVPSIVRINRNFHPF